MGELLTRGTIDLALIGFFGSWLLSVGARSCSRSTLNLARFAWSAGALLLLVHMGFAFHFYHDWSHSAAVADTARKTQESVGLAFGGGVWVNYLFAIVWLADALWWWRVGHNGYQGRSTWRTWGIHGFLLFIVINGAIVFESGLVRWLTLLAMAMLLVFQDIGRLEVPRFRKYDGRMAANQSVVILTAGAGGMYCGSCLSDNTLAAALTRQGHDVQLVPTYTPIRTDDHDVSVDQVFFGGINIYLQNKVPMFRQLPAFMDRWLDSPRLIRWLTYRRMNTDAAGLGPLTVSILKGAQGNQRKEVHRLCDWLAETRPALVNLSNMLIAGFVPELRRRLDVPVIATLQGDDIFLRGLPDSYQQQALKEIRRIDADVDAYLAHSEFYADSMSSYLGIDRAKINVVPLGIRMEGFDQSADCLDRPPTVGYLARLAPEKGLDVLCRAFVELRKLSGMQSARLRIAGWLGGQHEGFAEQVFETLRNAGCGEHFEYVGEVTRAEKSRFLASIDVLSVPCPYEEPKGIYVLEALAHGVPVVQPDHGAFPEIINRSGGGRLFAPDDVDALVNRLHELLTDHDERRELGRRGQQGVTQYYSDTAMAKAVWNVYSSHM